jgi:glycylpeptide N-tetradecanoyltransferase
MSAEAGAGAEELAEDVKALEIADPAAAEKKKKKKKKKKKTDGAGAGAGAEDEDDGDEDEGEDTKEKDEKEVDPKDLEKQKLLNVLRPSRICEESRRQAGVRYHTFWSTQPVPSMHDEPSPVGADGPIDAPKTVDDVRADPLPLPAAFEWGKLDVDDPDTLNEVYELLNGHYVEDDDCMFRFDYSREFIKWALKPPHYKQEWHVGVQAKQSGKLVAFITGIPAVINVRGTSQHMAEINFLCVHKKLRSKRLAPVLIKEVTRRVNRQGVWQAVYTAGVVLPRPVAECRYYHRSLNPKKLIEVGFSHLGQRMTIARTVKLYKLPDEAQTPNLKQMEEKHCGQVHGILTEYLKKFDLHPEFTVDEIRHWLLPRDGVVYSFVIETDGKVTDLCSFYSLPSSILDNEKYSHLRAAYAYWHVPNTVTIDVLMNESLIQAKKLDFDVFNALNVMENDSALKALKFGIGDGFLQYYLYNWKTALIQPNQIGLVLL